MEKGKELVAADKALAKKVINGINELTKETALKLDLMLLALEEALEESNGEIVIEGRNLTQEKNFSII